MAVWSEVKRTNLVDSRRIDADYFRPEYIDLEKSIKILPGQKLGYDTRLVKCGPFGSTIKKETYKSEGVIVARPFNIHDMQFEYDNLAYISESDFNNKKLISCMDKDIFFARVGDVKVGILQKKSELSITISPNIVLLRLDQKTLRAEYTTIFFNTKYGLKQIIRAQKVVAQPTISTSLLNSLFVYNPGYEIQDEISDIFNKAMALKESSKGLYKKAEELLEKEIGLDRVFIQKAKTSESSFSEVVKVGRVDADYYQTHFRLVADHINTIQTQPLSQIVYFIKGIEVGSSSYTDNGKLFIRVSNVKKSAIVTGNSDKYIAESLLNTLKIYQPIVGDVLLTKDGTLGECYVVDEEIEGIISGGIMKLTLKNNSIPAEYLSLVINSKICKLQIERVCSGALILHWKPKDIASLKMPILGVEIMTKLAELVISSKQAKRESEILLEKAKKRIEDLIEGVI